MRFIFNWNDKVLAYCPIVQWPFTDPKLKIKYISHSGGHADAPVTVVRSWNEFRLVAEWVKCIDLHMWLVFTLRFLVLFIQGPVYCPCRLCNEFWNFCAGHGRDIWKSYNWSYGIWPSGMIIDQISMTLRVNCLRETLAVLLPAESLVSFLHFLKGNFFLSWMHLISFVLHHFKEGRCIEKCTFCPTSM